MIGTHFHNWVKARVVVSNGREAFIVLSNHYGGTGYSSKQLGEADTLQASFHYQSECS